MPESLPGALTLALDILENERENNIMFDHIFIDSGTGMIACATLLAFAWLKKNVKIHVVLMAEEETKFREILSSLKIQFEELVATKLNMPSINSRLALYQPSMGRPFGSTNKLIFNEIRRIASAEGFLTDPIYSVKLFMKARSIISKDDVTGNCLLIHSGGALTLAGFQDQLSFGPSKCR
jgi:1-aminocyclopropane-1-carboxylate deaminase/D-cysteine desulfhydrase-like pyridoxal-dependent ACC family enzyme